MKYCPVCHAEFEQFAPVSAKYPRLANCPSCGSRERHRLLALVLNDILPKGRMLHFAPEPWLERHFLERYGRDYFRVDFARWTLDARVDIQRLPFPDSAFSGATLMGVLEHIPNDYKAMKEVSRVLRPGGTAIIHVPLQFNTRNSWRDRLPRAERARKYGQPDHRRMYGLDILDQLEMVFNRARLIRPEEVCSAEDMTRYGLQPRACIIHCSK